MVFMNRIVLAMSGFCLVTIGGTHCLRAHPHVWVQTETIVLFDKGNITGLQEKWTFDEYYTAMSIEGLDKNGDGVYAREELQELAQVNIDGMKDFDYFTYAKFGKDAAKFGPPKDYYLEHKNGILSLFFTLPLAGPVNTGASDFEFIVDDPSFFIAFTPAEKSPVVLSAGAPKGCTAKVVTNAKDEAEAKRLQDAFNAQLAPANAGGAPMGMSKLITVACAKG